MSLAQIDPPAGGAPLESLIPAVLVATALSAAVLVLALPIGASGRAP